jgi:hypothetical protein
MKKAMLAAAAAAAIFATVPLFVGTSPAQAQRIEVNPGGVRVDPDRRLDPDRRRGRRCVTEVTTRETPSGRIVRERRTVCSDRRD